MINKMVILAGGVGKRMQAESQQTRLDENTRKVADSGIKALIPINDRPFLDYCIHNIIKAGFTDLCLVLGPNTESIREYYEKHKERLARKGVSISYALQEKPLGTGNALLAANTFAGKDSFCMVNCDNLYSVKDLQALREAREGECYMIVHESKALVRKGNIPAERIKRFGIVDFDSDFRMKNIVEKPENPEKYSINGNIHVSMSCFRFTPAIFISCKNIKPHPVRGEYELTSAIHELISKYSVPVKVIPSHEPVLDLTGKTDIESVAKILAKVKIDW